MDKDIYFLIANVKSIKIKQLHEFYLYFFLLTIDNKRL